MMDYFTKKSTTASQETYKTHEPTPWVYLRKGWVLPINLGGFLVAPRLQPAWYTTMWVAVEPDVKDIWWRHGVK